METSTPDQPQTEVITSIIIESVPIQTLGKDIIQSTVLEDPLIIETETFRTIEKDNTQITDHKNNQTRD